ncbi:MULTISPECIES: prepilin peptidase [Streptomyces]|uniref:Peptidase A24 n=2 Tax=Streptomyces TaxID=1883 RepID=A0A2N8PDV9_STRNR|nr:MULTISPECIES: A24 family peptidase [Streptomyces]PNE39180.1 peptidase A24 [Streptomyces noursei]SHL27522.1 leader peptidase (prepilin peptidase) / N-methyltransferase [Streptomyces yunnanensis]
MSVTLIALAAAYGAATGLLIPRPAHRLSVDPEEDWRAHCPDGHPLTGAARGWLGRGHCPHCRAPYGPPAPPIATATALACAALATTTGARPELAVWLLMTPLAVLLTLVDHRVQRLPDVLTLPLAGTAATALGAVGWLTGDTGSWLRALLGGTALAAFYLLLHLLNPAGLGRGDVKLALGLGVALGWYGWPTLLTGGAAGLLIGALFAAGLLLARRTDRKATLPLGPFMIIGAFCGLLLGAAASP